MARALLTLALLVAGSLSGQTPTPVVHDTLWLTNAPAQLVVADSVRQTLDSAWEAGPDAHEQGWCVTTHAVRMGGVPLIYLDAVTRPDSVWAADAYRVAFRCGTGTAWLHTHTPVTCEVDLMLGVAPGTCHAGGVDAWECQPSPSDQMRLTASGRPVAFIQCDRHAVIAYYPVRRVALTRSSPP